MSWPETVHQWCKWRGQEGKKVFTDGEVLGTSFKQRVLCGLCGFASAERRGGRFLSCSFLDGRLVIETGPSVISHGGDRRQCVAPRRSNALCTKVHTSPAKYIIAQSFLA